MNTFVFWILIVSLSGIGLSGIVYIIFMVFFKKKETTAQDYEKVYNTIHSLSKDADSNSSRQSPHDRASSVSFDRSFEKNFHFALPYKLRGRKLRKYLKQIDKNLEGGVIVFMQTLQGNFRTWIQKETADGFIYNKKQYIFDDSNKLYIENLKQWVYFYNEALDIPTDKRLKLTPAVRELVDDIQKRVDSDFKKPMDKKVKPSEIRDSIDAYGLSEVETAFDPMSLKRFIDTQVILQVMGGAWFTKIMKIVLIAVLILLVMGILTMAGIGYVGWETYQAGKG